MSPTFSALANFNYRIWFVGAVVSNTGTWMQRVAQDWLVLTVLTQESGVALGITTGLQFGPMLLLAPVSGLLADRLPKRRLVMGTQATSGLCALVLGLLVVTGNVELWHVFVLAGLLGASSAIDLPASQTFVAEMVTEDHLTNAVALNSASLHSARLLGPGVAGVLISLAGTGPVFLVNAATFTATFLALSLMRPHELTPMPRARRKPGQLQSLMRYVAGRQDLVIVMMIIGVVGAFGINFQMTTALMARLEFDRGASEYGLLGSVMAIGSLAGTLFVARGPQPGLRLVVGATLAFGVCALLAASMPSYPWFAVSLVPLGFTALVMMTSANALVQLTTEPQLRGRVMSLYMAVFMGGTPVAAPIIGWVGETYGAPWTIAIGGVTALTVAVVAIAMLGRTRDISVTYRLSQRPHLLLSSTARAGAPPSRHEAIQQMAADQAQDTATSA